MQAPVQDIEAYQQQNAAAPLEKQPSQRFSSSRADANGKPIVALKQITGSSQQGSLQQDLSGRLSAHTEAAKRAQPHSSSSAHTDKMKLSQAAKNPSDEAGQTTFGVRVMTDDTAEIRLGDSWASSPTPFGTMEADEAGAMLAAAKQAPPRADDTWGVLGLAPAPCIPHDARMAPTQLDDSIGLLNDSYTAPTSLGDTAYASSPAPTFDGALADSQYRAATPMNTMDTMSMLVGSQQGPATPMNTMSTLADSHYQPATPANTMSTLADSQQGPATPMNTMSTLTNGSDQRNQGFADTGSTGREDFETAEEPHGVRFRDGEDSMIRGSSGMDAGYVATLHVARSPRNSGAWQTQMGSVAGWQALASEV